MLIHTLVKNNERYKETFLLMQSSNSLTAMPLESRQSISVSPSRNLKDFNNTGHQSSLLSNSLALSKFERLDLEISQLKTNYNKEQGLTDRKL